MGTSNDGSTGRKRLYAGHSAMYTALIAVTTFLELVVVVSAVGGIAYWILSKCGECCEPAHRTEYEVLDSPSVQNDL